MVFRKMISRWMFHERIRELCPSLANPHWGIDGWYLCPGDGVCGCRLGHTKGSAYRCSVAERGGNEIPVVGIREALLAKTETYFDIRFACCKSCWSRRRAFGTSKSVEN